MKRSLNCPYHAFAPHYAPRYPAEFQYRFNRHYDLPVLSQRLLTATETMLPLSRPILLSVA